MRDLPIPIRTLIEAAHQAPSADNSQPFRFVWTGEAVEIHFDSGRVGGKIFDSASLATQLAAGAALENMMLFASAMRMPVRVGPINSQGPCYVALHCNISAVAQKRARMAIHPVFLRHTNRWPYQKIALPGVFLDRITAMKEGPCRLMAFSTGRERRVLARLTRIASEVRFQTPEIHQWLDDSLRLTREEAQRNDGLALETLGLPPGGKQFLGLIRNWRRMSVLNRIGAYKVMSRVESLPIEQAPTILAIVGPADGSAGFEAGRLMERVWIETNRSGVAVHPGFVVPDQLSRLREGKVGKNFRGTIETLARESADLVGTESDMPYILLRTGYPNRHAEFSKRLATEHVCESRVAANETSGADVPEPIATWPAYAPSQSDPPRPS